MKKVAIIIQSKLLLYRLCMFTGITNSDHDFTSDFVVVLPPTLQVSTLYRMCVSHCPPINRQV